MSRVITSPVSRWPGTVTLADPLTFPQLIAWQDAVEAAGQEQPDLTIGGAASLPRLSYPILRGICAVVEKWELENFPAPVTPETFPATPRTASGRLLIWLISEISRVVTEADDLPNE